MDLHKHDLIIINTSGGKDSICAIFEILRLAAEQSYDKSKIFLSHQELGRSEWPGTKELVIKQAEFFGLPVEFIKRNDKNGYQQTLLEAVRARGKWPSNKIRYCTSDFKRGPGLKVVTRLTRGKDLPNGRVLYVFGFRAEESPSRKRRPVVGYNKNSTGKRMLIDFLPIHDWTTKQVWEVIIQNKIPYHYAYDLGMPRLSCVFCIFAPFAALVLAGIHNPELLDEYVAVEKEINHTFKDKMSLQTVKDAIAMGFAPDVIPNWSM